MTYIPCLMVMVKSNLLKHTAYKLMFYLGLFDMSSIFANSMASGIYSLNGDVACNGITFKYFLGCLGMYSWIIQSTSVIYLALTRLFELCEWRFFRSLFEKHRLYFWLLAAQVYGFIWLFYDRAALFTSLGYAWYFDPYYRIEEMNFIDRTQFKDVYFVIHNFVVGGLLPLIYFALSIVLWLKARHGGAKTSRLQYLITFQSFVISLTVMVGSMIYAYINLVEVAETFGLVASAAWLINSGCPSILYLTINQTIRQGVLQLLKCSKVESEKCSHSSKVNVAVTPPNAVQQSNMQNKLS
ncbi:hypothetical protein L596_020539 [Steinernema carpocapsae]|uniref:G-protein coupled receptors family 1 profile domain-containing protein n=1 Tax=Steinernema carpocapsae TaxID=34508 RepID=A0A4U5MTU9_STECR|nr:hypothetical protein L596_020539 [Steinernema carpocapsae]